MNKRIAWRRNRPDHRPATPAPTSVWPTGTSGLAAQLANRRYHPATRKDTIVMAPAIAEYAITHFTRPGDIVLDPDCGTGTTITEALRTGRHAVGLTTHRRWHLARANVTATKTEGAPGDGMVLLRHPSTMAAQTAGLTGRVDLLLTTLRPATSTNTALSRLRTLLHECQPLMRPGGHVVIMCPPRRHPIRRDLLDLPSQILTLGTTAGLAPTARCLALTADVRGHQIHAHTTPSQRRTARTAHATGHPIALPAYQIVLIFRADPDAADPVLAQPIPPLLRMPPKRRTHAPQLTATNPAKPTLKPDRVPVTAERAA